MNPGQELLVTRHRHRPGSEQPEGLLRPEVAPGRRFPLPMADLRDALRRGETSLAGPQRVERPLGPEEIVNPLAEHDPVDRFHLEIGGADLVRAGNRPDVIAAGKHHDGHAGPAGQRPQGRAGGKAVQPGHRNVEQDQLRPVLREEPDRLLTAGRLEDLESRRFERRAEEGTGRGVIVHGENQGRGRREDLRHRSWRAGGRSVPRGPVRIRPRWPRSFRGARRRPGFVRPPRPDPAAWRAPRRPACRCST